MKVVVEGFTSKLCIELEEASKFYATILLHETIIQQITLYIERKPDAEMHAEAFMDDVKGRFFTVEIRNHKDDDHPCQTLAHEMVHIKQWATRELVYRIDPLSPDGLIEVWKGKIWKPRPNEHPYFDAPYEVEAYGKEGSLYARWKAYRDGRPWK